MTRSRRQLVRAGLGPESTRSFLLPLMDLPGNSGCRMGRRSRRSDGRGGDAQRIFLFDSAGNAKRGIRGRNGHPLILESPHRRLVCSKAFGYRHGVDRDRQARWAERSRAGCSLRCDASRKAIEACRQVGSSSGSSSSSLANRVHKAQPGNRAVSTRHLLVPGCPRQGGLPPVTWSDA